MLNINQIALFALTAGSAVAAPFHLQQRQASGLNTAAVAAGKLYFGSATDNPELTDTAYTTGLSNTADFGQITPGNSMKWDTIEPSRGTFSYTKGDVIADLAEKNGQKLRCHTLVWYNQLPSWVKNGGFDNATLITILENHITNEVTHYKGKCYAWDVVNEAISDNGDGSYRSNVFYDTIGEAYIPIAFAAAAAADPDAKLYYNDYSIESAGAKSTRAQSIVKLIQSYGVRIDGVGLQSHFIVGSTPSTTAQVANMKAFTDLDVDVAITELDIRTSSPDTTTYETQQATDYSNTIKACAQTARCVGVTIWDYTDKYSWVPSTFSGQGAALPWDKNLEKKSAYDAILNAWSGAAAAPASSSSAVVASSSTSAIAKPTSTTSSPATTAPVSSSTSPSPSTTSTSAITSAIPSASTNATTTTTFACNPAHAYPNNASCISTAGSLTLVTPTASTSASASAAPAEHGGTTAAATLSATASASAAPEATSTSVAPTSSNVVSPVPTGGVGSGDDDREGECEVEYVYV